MRFGAILLVLTPLALASDCGGDPFAAGGGSDASTDGSNGSGSGSDGSGSGGDGSGSSSGGMGDATACTPSTGNATCDMCVAKNCYAEWCKCAGDMTLHNGTPGCLAYVGCVDNCLAMGVSSAVCAARCAPGYSTGEKSNGDALLGCIALSCLDSCKSGTSSGSSSGSGSGSGSSSGASSSSSGASSSSSGGPDSGSGGHSDGGGTCVCPACQVGYSCCTLPTSTNYCKCESTSCLSCCM
jgi:hypothetical protein